MTCVALLSSAMLFASFASAKPTKPEHPTKAKDTAAKQCAAAKQADKAAFRALYGKHAMRTCVKGEAKEGQGELKNAAKECKAEQAVDPAAFDMKYGDPYTSNAFGKCVSSKSQSEDATDVTDFQNAAGACRDERSADPAAFKDTYGSAKSKGRNAFGKCVSAKAKAADAEVEPVA